MTASHPYPCESFCWKKNTICKQRSMPAIECNRPSQFGAARWYCTTTLGRKIASTPHISKVAVFRGNWTTPRKSVTTSEATAASQSAIASQGLCVPMA